MRRFFKEAVFLLIFLNLTYSAVYSLDDKERLGIQSAQTQQQQQIYQNQQPQRPILPPVVPLSQLGISPTPSPQITAPLIPPTAITPPSFPPNYQPATIQTNYQSSPAQAILPNTNVPTELPQIPIIGNSIGKVISRGSEKDGLPWIEVKDEIFNETLKIKINPKTTPVIKKSTVMSFPDINIGDTVNVIFNQQDENIIANFISILTEEDLKAMEESLPAPSEE
ncbi:MAG: hypothetical protein KKB22_03785 [Candidatus Omnitrophica bacterium]|nr:hypothetical protein [Candidatus Omnitrophota bacterium]